jgi:hypothetical protein
VENTRSIKNKHIILTEEEHEVGVLFETSAGGHVNIVVISGFETLQISCKYSFIK